MTKKKWRCPSVTLQLAPLKWDGFSIAVWSLDPNSQSLQISKNGDMERSTEAPWNQKETSEVTSHLRIHFRGAPNRFRGSVRSVILSDEWNSWQQKDSQKPQIKAFLIFLCSGEAHVILWFKLWSDSQWLAWKHRGSWHQGKGQVPSNLAGMDQLSIGIGDSAMARQGHGDSGDNLFCFGFYEMKLDRKSPAAKGKHFTGSLGAPTTFWKLFFSKGGHENSLKWPKSVPTLGGTIEI